MKREEVLAFEVRRRLFHMLEANPGLHLREIERASDMPLSTLRYHLDYLQRHGLVEVAQDKYYRRYFTAMSTGRADRRVLAALRQEALRRLVLHLLAHENASLYRNLRKAFDLPESTLQLHLSELVKRGVLRRARVGRETLYEVVEPEQVVQLLHTYRESFLDGLVDHLLAAVYQEDADDETP